MNKLKLLGITLLSLAPMVATSANAQGVFMPMPPPIDLLGVYQTEELCKNNPSLRNEPPCSGYGSWPGVPERGTSSNATNPLAYVTSSQKQFRMCNKSNDRQVFVAYAYHNGQNWVKKGWYKILRGQCSTLANVHSRYIYFYAEGSKGGRWAGSRPWCVHPTARFSLLPVRSIQECTTPYETRPFVQVDTGNARVWTQNLLK